MPNHKTQHLPSRTVSMIQSTLTELTRENCILACALHRLADQDICRPDVMADLVALQRRLGQHIEREQAEVYAPLADIGQHHRDVANTLRIFSADTEARTRRVLDFFEQYATGRVRDGFADACASALTDLRERIRREETLLFPALAHVMQRS